MRQHRRSQPWKKSLAGRTTTALHPGTRSYATATAAGATLVAATEFGRIPGIGAGYTELQLRISRAVRGQSGTITAGVNALAKAGVELGENRRDPKAQGEALGHEL